MARWITPLQQLIDLRDEYKKKIEETFADTCDIYAVVKTFDKCSYTSKPFVSVDVFVGVDVLDTNDISVTVVITPIEPDKKWNVEFIAVNPNVVETYEDTWELSV